MKLMVINGPNLNMLGIREQGVYGSESYDAVCSYIQQQAEEKGHQVTVCQSNAEGGIIDYLQQAYIEGYEGVIINPGAYTHYSYAIHDAIKSIVGVPAVEVHLSNVHAREEFRHVSRTAPACIGQLCGFGKYGYSMAMDALWQHVKKNDKK